MNGISVWTALTLLNRPGSASKVQRSLNAAHQTDHQPICPSVSQPTNLACQQCLMYQLLLQLLFLG